MGEAPDYTIDPAWMDRVQQVVDWSLEEGLYVMINVHHDAWMWLSKMPTNHDEVLARYTAIMDADRRPLQESFRQTDVRKHQRTGIFKR